MASSSTSLQVESRTEDVLAHLPVSRTKEYAKGRVIYSPINPSNHIFLVVTGKVRTSRIASDGSEVLLELVRPDELFGESAFLDSPHHAERATAVEPTKLMLWAVADMEALVVARPRLALAMLHLLARRNAESASRIESFAIDSIEQRLARSLLRFSDRFGTPEQDGSERMLPLTHALLSQYVGTSRELVTHYMGRFRKRGFVTYSRHGIFLRREALMTMLDHGNCRPAAIASRAGC